MSVKHIHHSVPNHTRSQIGTHTSPSNHTHQVSQGHAVSVYPLPAPSYALSLWLFPATVIAALVLAAAFIARLQKRRPAPPATSYTAAPSLLTATELHFWQSLRTATGTRAHVLMKVRQADILLADRGDRRSFARVSQKHIDFLLCDPVTLKPLAGVELDDRSHERQDRRERDAFVDAAYRSAGIPLLHIKVSSHYDTRDLAAMIDTHLPRAIILHD